MDSNIIRLDLHGVNAYLIKTKEGFALIDTGGQIVTDSSFNNRRELLVSLLSDLKCTPDNLFLLILTHGDNDHAANGAYIKNHYHVPAAIHSADRILIEKPDLPLYMKSYNYKPFFLRVLFHILSNKIRSITAEMINNYEPFSPDLLLTDGERLDRYGIPASVLHLPGHTPGSAGILFDNGDFIAGDVFSNNGKPKTAANGWDFSQMDKSLRKLDSCKIKKVYPGHGEPFLYEQTKKGYL